MQMHKHATQNTLLSHTQVGENSTPAQLQT